MGKCLVVIDMQNDYYTGGAMELVGIAEASRNAAKIIKQFRDEALPVIHIQHLSVQPGATFFLPGTDGCEINDEVKPLATEVVVQKNFPSSFQNTTLEEELNKVGATELVICGSMTHMCIDTTTRAAFERGYMGATLIGDACATCDLEFGGRVIPAADVHDSFLAALGMVFANVVTADEYLK